MNSSVLFVHHVCYSVGVIHILLNQDRSKDKIITVILLIGLGYFSGTAPECANACKFFPFPLLSITSQTTAHYTICVFATVSGKPMTE